MTPAVLYLDLDGVLHPEDVILDIDGRPHVRSPQSATLFENASLLEQLLEPYANVRIILSTSWVRTLGHDRTVAYLPPALASRVVGSTYVPSGAWGDSSSSAARRGREVLADVRRRAPWEWLAIDDCTDGWPEYALDHVVFSDPIKGIRHPTTHGDLMSKLQRFASSERP